MHNFSPTSPVLGDPLQLLPAAPRLGQVARCFPPSFLPSRIPHQDLSCDVAVWLSQGVVKFVCSLGPLKCYITQMGVGGVRFSGKKRYEGVMFNVINVTRGWGSNLQKNSVT